MITTLTIIMFTTIFTAFTCQEDLAHRLLNSHQEQLIEHRPLQGGMTNNLVWLQSSSGAQYVLRTPKKLDQPSLFQRTLLIAQAAAKLGISPTVIAHDSDQQALLLSYIPTREWPSYHTDPYPYIACMEQLRTFHNSLPRSALSASPPVHNRYLPFSEIIETLSQYGTARAGHSSILNTAQARVGAITNALDTWLEQHATLCHEDFHAGNTLLPVASAYPLLIDFDSSGKGHPYFDIVKFTRKMPLFQRVELFAAYLGHAPTAADVTHFSVLDNLYLALVAGIKLKKYASHKDEAVGESAMADAQQYLELSIHDVQDIRAAAGR